MATSVFPALVRAFAGRSGPAPERIEDVGLKIRRHRRGRMLDFFEIVPYEEPLTYLAGSENSPHLLLGDLVALSLAVLMTVLAFGAVLR